MKKYPLVSFIILNWNGKKWLKQCLPSVKKVTYPNKEIILVNNGSTDDSKNYVERNYPEIRIIELEKNVGYARANNIGVKSAKGKYVLLLNNDTLLTPVFLDILVKRMEEDLSIGAIQPQMRSLVNKNLLDSAGGYLTSTGFLYYFGYMKNWNNKKYLREFETYTIKGSCFLMLKKDYINLGGLDEDFVCYVEETDLCHRIWLSGKRILFEPKSVMYHYGGGDMNAMTKNELTIFRAFRNRIISYLKNLSLIEIIKVLPIHILFCEIFVIFSLFSGKFKKSIAVQLGLFASVIMLPSILKKRRHIQNSIRKVSDKELMGKLKINPRLSYYYYLFSDIKKYKD